MQFKLLSALTFALSLSQASAQLSASDVVDNIEKITDLSKDTNDIAEDLSGPKIFLTAPKLVGNFKEIISTGQSAITSMKDKPSDTFKDSDQQDICDAFRTFVKVHQNLLNTVIGKSGILSGTPFTAPLAAVLRGIEDVVDTLAFGIIDTVPTCADGAQNDLDDLDKTIGDAIDEFSFKLPFGQ